jgi:hypothetical protein
MCPLGGEPVLNVRIDFCALTFGVALVVTSLRVWEHHRASGSRASQGDRERAE